MSLLAADRFIWLLAALPVIVFYILKPRLRQRRVSTLLFWEQIFEEKRQRSLWQNLRHWLSLLMQLLFIGCLVFALVDPIRSSLQNQGQELILIIDNSASMQAVDSESGQTRLELACEQADQLIQGLRPGDKASVLTCGCGVSVVSGMTDFIPTLRQAVDAVESTDGPADLENAIATARRLSPDEERRRIVIVSDACDLRVDETGDEENASTEPALTENDAQEDASSGDDDLLWVGVGSDAENVAITQFQARRSTVDPLGYSLLVEVQNFSKDEVTCRFKLELGDALVDVIPLKLAAGETWRKTVEATSETGGILTGTVDHDDALAVDNVSRAVVPNRPRIAVKLVKAVDVDAYYLTSVLNAIPLLDVTVTDLQEFESPAEESDTVGPVPTGLTVFSGVVPKEMPAGPVLFVGPSDDGPQVGSDDAKIAAWSIGPELTAPLIAEQDPDSPLLRHVKMQNVLLDGGRDIRIGDEWGQATTLLKTADESAVMVAVEREAGRVVVLSANLDSSDLPLRIAFPVMMTNSVNWFLRQSNEIQPALATGQPMRVPWTQKELNEVDDRITLVSGRGDAAPMQIDGRRIVVGPQQHVGVYAALANFEMPSEAEADAADQNTDSMDRLQKLAAEESDRSQLLAVNLCRASESNLKIPELPDQSDKSVPASGLPIWLLLAFVAAAFILTEWVMYHRRVIT